MTILEKTTKWLLPHYCILCYEKTKGTKCSNLCANCQLALPLLTGKFCYQCAYPLPDISQAKICGDCIAYQHHFDASIVAFHYQSPIDRIILDFKHRANFLAYRELSCHLVEAIKQSYDFINNPPDMLVPAPLHWQRQFHRGFNQAQLIAEQLSEQLSIPINNTMLRRVNSNAMQQGKSRRERIKALNNQFAINELTDNDQVKGKNIAIIDDVVTTTATTEAIAKQLKRAGAQSVVVYALARTVKHL